MKIGVVVLEPSDVGHRVVVRHRTDRGPTDVLGDLVSFDDDRLVVRTERGEERAIARAAVIAGKPIGPRPARFSEIVALERVADRAWRAPVVERLGGWLLRAAEGWTNRANSALPLGPADRDLDEAVRATQEWYEARDLPPKITVPLPLRRDVAAHLEGAGWVAQPTVLGQTAAVDALANADVALNGEPRAVTLHEQPSAEFLALVGAWKQSLPEAAAHVLRSGQAVRFAQALSPAGTLVAAARGAVVAKPASPAEPGGPAPGDGPADAAGPQRERWLHIGLVHVQPSARRRGLARAMTSALASWARSAGASRAVLQVEERNEAAVKLYASLGFTTHHTYVTYHRRDV
jgi:ribosomal protein S18 acetylase RimI-like enzyme